MEFWNSILTEKSWKLLQELHTKPFRFILIGGWAAYMWTKLHKSKDIDIILCDFKDLDYVKQHYTLKKNDALKKYEIQFGDIDVDIYVAHYSKFPIPITDIKKYTTTVENIKVVTPEILLILKQAAELDRKHSIKGGKDRIDIITLLLVSTVDFKKYKELLKKYQLDYYLPRLKEIISDFDDIRYLNLNQREYAMKKRALEKELNK